MHECTKKGRCDADGVRKRESKSIKLFKQPLSCEYRKDRERAAG